MSIVVLYAKTPCSHGRTLAVIRRPVTCNVKDRARFQSYQRGSGGRQSGMGTGLFPSSSVYFRSVRFISEQFGLFPSS